MTALKNPVCTADRFICVPLCMQETEYTCGITCVQSILGLYGMVYRQDVLAKEMESKPVIGTDYHNILRFMRGLGFMGCFLEGVRIKHVKHCIDKGLAPLLLIQAWGDEGVDYTNDWKDAHYVIACGYEGSRIYIMDPYTLGNYTYLPARELVKRWHVADQDGRRSYRSMLVFKKDSPVAYDPCEVKYLG